MIASRRSRLARIALPGVIIVMTTGCQSLDSSTSAGIKELQGMRHEARKLTETATEVKPKVAVLRHAFVALRDANYDPRLTKAAQRLVVLTDDLSSAYEDLETLALKVSFSADQR